jgi:hypothetical protein
MARSGSTSLAFLFLLIVPTTFLSPPAAAQTPVDMDATFSPPWIGCRSGSR